MSELPDTCRHPRRLAARRAADRGADSVVGQARTARGRRRHRGAGDGGDRVRLAVEGARAGRRRRTGRRAAPTSHGIEFSALVASPNGAKRAIAAGLRSIEYVVSAADGHSRANVGRSTAEATALIAEIVAIAHDSDVTVEVIIATAWDCPFDGPTPPQRVRRHRRRRPATPAPTGSRSPTPSAPPRRGGSATWSRASGRVIGDLPLGAHFHNTRGAGLASAYAAVSAGRHPARRVGRRARRLPVRARRQRQHRHRGPGVPVARQRDRRRRRPARPRSPPPASRRTPSATTCPSALLRAGDRILG